jgi:molecular chaperone GrpE
MEDQRLDSAATAEVEKREGGTESLREQLAAANAHADENYNRFLLAAADLDNYKKRTERDFRKILTDRRRTLLERFLPVLDNLERALDSDAGGEALRNGIEQTLRGFKAVLDAEGVSPIDVSGKTFDPQVAEAIGTAEPADGVADDTVVEVSQKGYTLDGELLRPAKVIVAKHVQIDSA